MLVPIDFNKVEIAKGVFYGGDAGAKEAIIYDDGVWMLKYPKTARDMRNPQISYTTSSLSEYLGSKIYETLGIPVHETLLGIRNNKVVTACKDFTRAWSKKIALYDTDRVLNSTEDGEGLPLYAPGVWQEKYLVPFHDLKNSFMSSDLESYSGTGSETLLDEVLATIAGQSELKTIPGALERFWDMFVIDAFIDNNDRNNGNWGILIDPKNNAVDLAPVYDNGNAFFNKRSLAQMTKRLNDENAMQEDAYKTLLCAYKYTGLDNEGQKINPFTFIKHGENSDCLAAVLRFVNTVDMNVIKNIIYDIPESVGNLAVMPEVQKEFYLKLMQVRLEILQTNN